MAAELSSELQAVLQEALQAQDYEDDGDISPAYESYYRASCQMSYLLDSQVEKGTALEGVCARLVQMYQHRATVLKGRQEAAKDPHWVQLEHLQPPAALVHEFTSSATTSAPFALPSAQHMHLQMQLVGTHQQQQQHQRHALDLEAAAEAADLQPGSDEPASPAGSTASLELLRTCQRAVSGGLDDVVGLESVKEELEEAVFLPLEHPQLFKGIRQPARAFLLYGPPGTGKTMLVEKVAAEAGFVLLSISPSMIMSKWAGDSEKAISGVFDLARSFQPCIIFLDEVDSLGQSRGSSTEAGARRLLTELLIQFSRAAGEEGVYIFGATNRIQDCDPALLRRFSRRIEVPLPDASAREAFFQSVLSRPELDSDLTSEDVGLLAQAAQGYSGSDLAEVCRTAAMAPVRELMQQQRSRKRRRRGGTTLELLGAGCHRRSSTSTAFASHSDAAAGADVSAGDTLTEQQAVVAGDVGAAAAPEKCSPGAAAAPCMQSGQHQSGAGSSMSELRPLTLADFQAALALVKPAAVDAGEVVAADGS